MAGQLDVPVNARIVEIGSLTARTAATIGPPIYRLGWAGEHDFGYVMSGVLLSDGSAAVLDGLANQLVIIGPSGQVTRVLGRKGQGPGEFEALRSVTRKGEDTLVVEDDRNLRLSYFHDGRLIRDERFSDMEMANGYISERWYRGALYWTRWSVPSPLPEGWTHNVVVRSRSAASPLDTVASYRIIASPRPSMANPFRSAGKVGLTTGAVIAGWSNEAGFVRFPLDGGVPLHVSWVETSPTLTDSIWDSLVEYERGRFEGRNAELRIGRRSAVHGPLPKVGALVGDSEGQAWLSRWGVGESLGTGYAGPYRVFGADGSWLGWVDVPSGMRILDIRLDRVLAVQRDEFDVQAVVVLPMVRSTGAGR